MCLKGPLLLHFSLTFLTSACSFTQFLQMRRRSHRGTSSPTARTMAGRRTPTFHLEHISSQVVKAGQHSYFLSISVAYSWVPRYDAISPILLVLLICLPALLLSAPAFTVLGELQAQFVKINVASMDLHSLMPTHTYYLG